MRLSIIVIIGVLIVGSIVTFLGVITNQESIESSKTPNQYENLEKYKNELEEIILYNQEILEDLENQIKTSDNIHLEQINEEIKTMKKVISQNTIELEQIIRKLSEMKSLP